MGLEERQGGREPGEAISAEAVIGWLEAHPHFLADNPDLLGRLMPVGAERPDGAVDLRAYLVERLRDEGDRLRQTHRALIGATRANLQSQTRVHATVLALLDAESFEHLIQIITTDLAVHLDLDVAGLVVECNGCELPRVRQTGVRVVGAGVVGQRLGGQDIRLEGDIVGEEALFGAGAGLVRSQALVRLNVSSESPACLLVLGSREPDTFHAGLGTELVAFLAQVLARCIRNWLDLPP